MFALMLFLCLMIWFLWRLYSNRHSLPCPAWLSWLIELDNPFAKAHKAQAIIESLTITEGDRILDIGCGPGRVMLPLAKKIAEKKGHVTGLDIQSEMIEKAKDKALRLDIANVDFICGKIDEIELNKGYYDIVLMVCVLGEIPKIDRLMMLTNIADALKSKGIISITETLFDPHFQSQKKVVELMEKIGFVQTNFIGNRFAYTAQFKKENKNDKY